MTNKFLGLARGPIDHQSSSVINMISEGIIEMGAVIRQSTNIAAAENLARAERTTAATQVPYGIAVGGDLDGIFSTTGAATNTDATRASNGAGQGVVIVTQGRCPALVDGTANIATGDALTNDANGVLVLAANATDVIIARALQTSSASGDIIAVDVQREGLLT